MAIVTLWPIERSRTRFSQGLLKPGTRDRLANDVLYQKDLMIPLHNLCKYH